MQAKLGLKAIAATVALVMGSSAMANTSLNATSGDLFFNLTDTVTNASYLFDTGISQASFSGSGTYNSGSLISGDSNFTSFLAGAGADALSYSVISVTQNLSVSPKTENMFFTSSLPPSIATRVHETNAVAGVVNSFWFQANQVATSSTTSVNLPAAQGWGNGPNEGVLNINMNAQDSAAPGTALAFYQEGVTGNINATTPTDGLNTFAGTWLFSSGTLTYGSATAVPLPAPLVLLLSGLALMGVVARRKSGAKDVAFGIPA